MNLNKNNLGEIVYIIENGFPFPKINEVVSVESLVSGKIFKCRIRKILNVKYMSSDDLNDKIALTLQVKKIQGEQ